MRKFHTCLSDRGYELVRHDEYGPEWRIDNVKVFVLAKRHNTYRVEVDRNGRTYRSVEMAASWPVAAVMAVVDAVWQTRHENRDVS